MPLLQVIAPKDALIKKDQDELMSRLSNALLKAERAPIDDAGAQSLIWAYYIEQPEGTVYIGGENIEQAPIRIAVTTPEGALNQNTRAEFVAAAGEIVDDVLGTYEGRLNHWTMLSELKEGSWAGAGQVFHLEDIKAAMNIKAA